MSLRSGGLVSLAIAFAVGCGSPQSDAHEPKTAKEKQLQEARASGEVDDASGNKWAGWRYQGERKDCRYVFGRKCFKTQKAACTAGCKTASCDVVGGGPATVTCKKSDAKKK